MKAQSQTARNNPGDKQERQGQVGGDCRGEDERINHKQRQGKPYRKHWGSSFATLNPCVHITRLAEPVGSERSHNRCLLAEPVVAVAHQSDNQRLQAGVDEHHYATMKHTEKEHQTPVSGRAGPPRLKSQRRPKKEPEGGSAKRNTKRGLRSQDAIIRRRASRSYKRNVARAASRKVKSGAPFVAPQGAQEPSEEQIGKRQHTQAKKLEYGKVFRAATLNTQGMKRAAKRDMIEAWMEDKGVSILAIQETHINTTHMERRKRYTWFFSGSTPEGKPGNIYAGVGFVIKNTLLNYVSDMRPISDRVMDMTLGATLPITIISIYAPTAEHPEEEKDLFYKLVQETYQEHKSRGPTLIIGDFNARLQCKACEAETCIGEHTFDKANTSLEYQTPDVHDSRTKLVNFCMSNDCAVMNTMFEKPSTKLITHRHASAQYGPPWTRGRYEVLDYIVIGQRWKNVVTNAESDTAANIPSDHFPLKFHIRLKLKAVGNRSTKQRLKFDPCSREQRNEYNRITLQNIEGLRAQGQPLTYDQLVLIYRKAQNEQLPKITSKRNGREMSEATRKLIKDREIALGNFDAEAIGRLNKEIRASSKRDRKHYIQASIHKDMDVRDRWLGIRSLKQGFKPAAYHQKDRLGKHVPRNQRAEAAAKFWAHEIWGGSHSNSCEISNKIIVQQHEGYNLGEFSMQDLQEAIRKLKRRKAPGPDDITTEAFKEMSEDNLEEIRSIINQWWEADHIPEDICRARVVLLFKKGDSTDQRNYRPISLLNTTYKIIAAIVKNRIADQLDQHLQETQYGFRKRRSTSQAVFLTRRIIDLGERSGKQINMVLLDWEKAFDKVSQKCIFVAMRRLGIPEKLVNFVAQMYKHPQFRIEVDGVSSRWYTQSSGIRQGCPLSPYLFLIIMTVIFHDIHEKEFVQRALAQSKVLGTAYNEILYADDTILITNSVAEMELLVSEIETEGEKYGMALNYDKCESVTLSGNNAIRFKNGSVIPHKNTVKYLGCVLNDKGDSTKEVSKRLSECIVVWKKLDQFWKHCDCTVSQKVSVYDALIRAKLMYGLESAQLNESVKRKLDTFQLKGLRQILKLTTTYAQGLAGGERSHTNEYVFQEANRILTEHGNRKLIIRMSHFYEEQRRALIVETIRNRHCTASGEIMIEGDTLQLKSYSFKRVGRPRKNWYQLGIEKYWDYLRDTHYAEHKYDPLNMNNTTHISKLIFAAEQSLGVVKAQRSVGEV